MVVSSLPARGESPPPAPAGAATVPHWIGGRAVRGAGPAQEVFNPASGAVARHVACALPAEVAAAVASAAAALPAWADTPPLRRARVLQRFLALLNEQHDALAALITNEHGKVLERCAGRGDPRHRDRRVRLRYRAAAQGRLHRAGVHRYRQLDDAPAARRGRRHHAVQLSLHGAVLDVSDRDRLRQYLRAEAERARSVGLTRCWRSCWRRPACPPASSTSCRATRWRSMRCSTIRK